MERNMGGADRAIRLIAGIAVVGAGVYFGSWWGLLGLVLIGTAIFAVCPGYMPLGISTCGKGKEKQA
jgi:hypothetical protein